MMFKTLLITLFFLTFISAPLSAKTFKIATIAPDGTTWMEELKKGAKEIKERTDGRVKFRFYPGGIMGNDKSVLRKIRVGQLHGGAITGGGLSEIYSDAQIYSLPLAFRSYDEVDYLRKHMDDELIAGMKEKGFICLGIGEGGFAYVMSDKAISNVDDMSGNKVWGPEGDALSRAAFESVGVSPIPLPLTDVLTGLQTGLIDTVAASAMGAIALQWHTKIKHVTDTPLMYLYGTMVVKRKYFEKLSVQDQSIVQEVMSAVFERLDELNRSDNQKAKEALKAQGIHFVVPTKAEQAQWSGAVTVAIDKLIKQGIFSKKMIDSFNAHLTSYRKENSVLSSTQ